MVTGSQKADQIYHYIVQYKQQNDGNSPSYRQIAEACDVSSTSMVDLYIDELRRRNLVRLMSGGHGGHSRIVVVGGRWLPPGGILLLPPDLDDDAVKGIAQAIFPIFQDATVVAGYDAAHRIVTIGTAAPGVDRVQVRIK